jgi:DNA-binding MarR family transcriptional regulator
MWSMTVEPAPPLIGALVRRPAEAVHRRILREANEAGFTDLVPAHLAVLRYPGPNDRRPSELADEIGATKQAMNYLLGQLEQLGYLVRDADHDDKRARRVRVTKRGRVLRDCLRESVTRIENELEAELGPAEFNQLRTALLALNDTALVSEFRHYSGLTDRA